MQTTSTCTFLLNLTSVKIKIRMAQYTREEEYIVNESPEISMGETPGWTNRISNIFPAFQNRNYRLYFAGQLISLIGMWLQIVSESWLVLQLTNSPFLIGLVAAAATVPTLLFSFFGGVIVDKFYKKNILILTQTASMILALIYGLLTVLHIISVAEIIILAFLLGIVNALDNPARQAFVAEMVDKHEMPSAISLNSGMFNAARVIGPSVAGFLIAWVGTGGAFILNGISYIPAIATLVAMSVARVVHDTHPNPLHAIKEGISYSSTHPIIRTLLIFTGVVTIFGWSYTTILPLIAKNTFHLGADGLGLLYAATGLGAITAVLFVSTLAKKLNSAVFILGGNMLFASCLIIFSFVQSLPLALVCLFLIGMGLLAEFSTITTTLQHMVKDKYRGRVMSIYSVMFMGLAPLGSLQIGYLSEHFGTEFAIRIGAIITFLFGVLIYFNRNRIRKGYQQYSLEE
jgi:MFS family permease